MGRAGETVKRTFAMAGKNKADRGPLDGDDERNDNAASAALPRKAHHQPRHRTWARPRGRLGRGRQARRHRPVGPAYFGAKPYLVLKAGFPAWGVVGDPNATVDRAEPLTLGPQFGAHGAAPATCPSSSSTAPSTALPSTHQAARRSLSGVSRRQPSQTWCETRPSAATEVDTSGAHGDLRRGRAPRQAGRVGELEPALLPVAATQRRQPPPAIVLAMSADESPPRRSTSATRPIAIRVSTNISVDTEAISGRSADRTDEKT